MTITNITERERELSARVASDAELMAGLATMSQNYALKAKGLEEHLEIAQGTLKNLRARVAELEEELATAKRGIECYAMQLAKDTVQSDIDCIMAQGVEIAQLKAELAAVRAQKPWAYFDEYGEVTKIESPTAFRLSALDNIQCLYLAAGAQPLCKFPTCHSVDYQDELCKSLEDGRIDVPKGWQIVRIDAAQPVPEGMAIVPIEISEAMYEAYHKADNAAWCQMGASHGASIGDIWDAMLAAAKETK